MIQSEAKIGPTPQFASDDPDSKQVRNCCFLATLGRSLLASSRGCATRTIGNPSHLRKTPVSPRLDSCPEEPIWIIRWQRQRNSGDSGPFLFVFFKRPGKNQELPALRSGTGRRICFGRYFPNPLLDGYVSSVSLTNQFCGKSGRVITLCMFPCVNMPGDACVSRCALRPYPPNGVDLGGVVA